MPWKRCRLQEHEAKYVYPGKAKVHPWHCWSGSAFDRGVAMLSWRRKLLSQDLLHTASPEMQKSELKIGWRQYWHETMVKLCHW